MTVWYLQMERPEELRPASRTRSLMLEEVTPPDGKVNGQFYREVGAPWNWKSRSTWDDARWQQYVREEPIFTVRIREAGEGEVVGYSEARNLDGDVEITNYGLLLPFIGRGYGGAGLVEVVRWAWSLAGAHRVWLHTCERDHPNALNNYQRRGFRLFRTENEE